MRFEGGEQLARKLRALPPALSQKILRAALKEAAEPMRARMAAYAPREPGAPDLADNIGISLASRIGSTAGGQWRARHDAFEQAVAVGPTKAFFYGLFQEYGTTRHGAQPFMRPAFDEVSPESLGILGRALWEAIRKEAGTGSAQVPSAGGRLL